MTSNPADLALIQKMLAEEVAPDGTVPADFFQRLNRALNPPRPSILDRLLKEQKHD